jgi:hypothetical protein
MKWLLLLFLSSIHLHNKNRSDRDCRSDNWVLIRPVIFLAVFGDVIVDAADSTFDSIA